MSSYHDSFLFFSVNGKNSTNSDNHPMEENDHVILIAIGVSGAIVIIIVVVVIVVKKHRKANSRGRRRPKIRYNKSPGGTSES
jgi:heme/copper-type cytochrome/quinol oxidase subunit 2